MMLAVRNLNFGYEKDKPFFKGISFEAHEGDIIWLRGPNGCGKTTLLRIIAQLIEADCEIYYEGRNLTDGRQILSQLSYIPVEPYLFDYLTGQENANFIRALFDIPEEQFNQEFGRMIDGFQMNHALKQFVQEYSLGMRHKLYWSSVLARQTSIILLDEPFSSFDPEAQAMASQMLTDRAKAGALIIFISHLKDLSREIATRTLEIQNGLLYESSKEYAKKEAENYV
ncbi:ABC transporter ATP-binding protein [Paenibacillus humicus]|uniref:ABC transporter ATP-binding protein n=1 Tax=Paenibacillus humicus TaxID=412861 RepID=UPI003D26BA08